MATSFQELRTVNKTIGHFVRPQNKAKRRDLRKKMLFAKNYLPLNRLQKVYIQLFRECLSF